MAGIMNTQLLALIVAIAAAFGTGLASFVYNVFEDVIKEKLHEWGLIKEDRRRLIQEIITICAEGQEKGYLQLPESERKIHILFNQLESMDSPVLPSFIHFYNNWITTTTVSERADSPKEKEFAKEMAKEADNSRKQLLKALKLWRH